MEGQAPHPFEPPVSEESRLALEDGPPPKLQLTPVFVGIIVSFFAELFVTVGAAALYIGSLYRELMREPEIVFWQVMASPFLRMVSSLSGLPATMVGGFLVARKVAARPRAHALLMAVLYAGMLTAIAEFVLAREADSPADYVSYASTITGTLVGGLLGGLFGARGRRG